MKSLSKEALLQLAKTIITLPSQTDHVENMVTVKPAITSTTTVQANVKKKSNRPPPSDRKTRARIVADQTPKC